MIFKRAVQRYGQTPEPVTPYQKAGQVWDQRIGSATAQAASWRALAFLSAALSLALTGGMVWLAAQNRVTPYIVEVDRLGEVRALGPANAPYSPTDAQIAWHLSRFVANVRSLSIDPILVRQNWLEAYDFATDRAAQFLNSHAQANDPFADVGQKSVTVSVTSVVRASPTSFQVKWVEQAFVQGAPAAKSHWTAIMTIQQKTPKTEAVLRKNPLGLYITELAWTQDYADPRAAAPLMPTDPLPRAPEPSL